ncbi:MAG: hypothetical protein ACI9EZ_001898, partial [Halobacteriales archaeon]
RGFGLVSTGIVPTTFSLDHNSAKNRRNKAGYRDLTGRSRKQRRSALRTLPAEFLG